MCKIQCLLALFALSIGAVHSWDLAITIGDQLELYTNETKTTLEGGQFRDLTALAYDAVHNMLLFVDKQNDSASIFGYHLSTKKYQSLVRRRSFENIQGLAFDPVTNMLFWTDYNEKSIFSMSLKPDSKNDPYGNLLFKMDNEIPRGIAVDSCRGYVYWTNINVTKPTIERARFDGSDRQVIIQTDIYMPVSLAIDQKAKRLYWADDKEGIHYSIEASDLEGKNRFTLTTGINHQPNAVTVSKDAIYWVDWGYKTIWKMPKHAENSYPVEFNTYSDKMPFGIVANYDLVEQTEGVSECENLRALANNKSTLNETFSGVPPEMGLFCLHGMKVKGKVECQCTHGYIGDRCEISVCQNYCFTGDCSVDSEGKPTCRCDKSYKGIRCEVNVCEGHCLNNGFCSLNEKNEPTCHCLTDHEGDRCETEKIFTTVAPATVPAPTVSTLESCNCTQNDTKTLMLSSDQLSPTSDDFVTSTGCDYGWDSIRDPIILVLGILCGLLFLACALLVTKILHLKKRPRIRKRIIINKNVTPMTARPDQCEITIENCCNMNICETPCFEPRSTIRPTLLDSKPGKEEKKNLISNMEYPDDC